MPHKLFTLQRQPSIWDEYFILQLWVTMYSSTLLNAPYCIWYTISFFAGIQLKHIPIFLVLFPLVQYAPQSDVSIIELSRISKELPVSQQWQYPISYHNIRWVITISKELSQYPKSYHNIQWFIIISNELSQYPMSCHNIQWVFTITNEYWQYLMSYHNIQWVITVSNELSQYPMSCHNNQWVMTISNELSQYPMSYHSIQWVVTISNELSQ